MAISFLRPPLCNSNCFDRELDGVEVEDMNIVLDELVVGRTEFGGMRISVFSGGEEDEEWGTENVNEDYFLEDSEDERYF
ncbi:hypothetical protein SLEP1_g21655 [Rubroshorea leprosula]|uniref:Uncharacterized protein n=1 Tax=Rubroshorea leprosula TaxID=152421 RepID=A0AAV5JFY3_9ROSI|nr:hypothetical protein SLEP1_g21655 [Rubroshorea leprosula]